MPDSYTEINNERRQPSMKYLVICEKPSAAKAFANALGGRQATFEGDEYYITNLYGHIMEHGVPADVAKKEYKETVGGFSELGGIPWSADYFDFYNKQIKKGFDGYQQAYKNVKIMLERGYEPIIASDIDAMCEGDLLVHEVLDACGHTGKRYREFHVSEEVSDIQEAIRNKKEVTAKDAAYMTGFTRSNVDYMTQQLTRVATIYMQNQGYKLPGVVPFGRTQSVAISYVGAQLDAIEAYTPSSVYESRYKLDTLTLTNPDVAQFKTKEEWHADGLPLQAKVKKVKEVPGVTKPPKALSLTKLSSILAKKGLSSKRVQELTQKLYENGDGSGKNYISYPRTEDDTITHEQFREILPRIDGYIELLNLPVALFTHRQPRPTHVKDTGAHGALRPGAIPKTLDELDDKFGTGASLVYKTITERFLLQFLEDTEWVRHEYVTETNPEFKGSVKIITKQGVVDPDKKEETAKSLPDITKLAELYPHEVKSVRPKNPTEAWLLAQLEKDGVGTAATQLNLVVKLVGNTDKFPIRAGKVLSLSPIGRLGYEAAKGTVIGSVEGTRKLQEAIIGVRKGETTPEDVYKIFEEIIAKDVETIRGRTYDAEAIGLTKGAEKASGTWNGVPVTFKREYFGHRFTDEEVAQLLDNKEIEFECEFDGKKVKVKGALEYAEYNGYEYVRVGAKIQRDDQVTGVWNGRQINIKKSYGDHTYTQEELDKLFAGETITIEYKGAKYVGKLEEQEYKGHKYIAPKLTREGSGDYVTAKFKGKEISFNRTFMGHTFTDEELSALLNGDTIRFRGTTKSGEERYVTGSLQKQTYMGKTSTRFKAENFERIDD